MSSIIFFFHLVNFISSLVIMFPRMVLCGAVYGFISSQRRLSHWGLERVDCNIQFYIFSVNVICFVEAWLLVDSSVSLSDMDVGILHVLQRFCIYCVACIMITLVKFQVILSHDFEITQE